MAGGNITGSNPRQINYRQLVTAEIRRISFCEGCAAKLTVQYKNGKPVNHTVKRDSTLSFAIKPPDSVV